MASEVEQIKQVANDINEMVTKANEQVLAAAKAEADAAKNEALEAKNAVANLTVKYDEQQKQMDHMATQAKKATQLHEQSQKSFDQVLQETLTEATDDINKFARKETKSFSLELKAVGDVSTGNVTGGAAYGSIGRPGIIEAPKRKTHIRDLVPVGNIGPGTEFVFMRENGPGEGSIAPVAEGAMKPQIDVDLVEASVKIETIAGWLRMSRKSMNNIPGMISFLQSRLPEKLLRVEDEQLLSGDGVTPNIKGITAAGNHTAATSTAAVLVERIIDSLSLLEDTHERDATGILLRPADYYGFFKNKAAGSGEYDLPSNVTFTNGQLYISGVPVAASTALTAGKYIVGDFEMGAQLLIQEAMRLEFFEQDGTNVRENKVTVRIEETIAFPVYGDNYFIYGNTSGVGA